MATIFYYEDEDIWQKKYVGVMAGRGYSVKAFANNLEAEHAIRRNADWQPPDAAVVDIKDQVSQRNSGFRICEELRRRWPSVPVVFLTSSDHGTPEELAAIGLHATYYIYKLKDPEGLFLLAALESALERADVADDSYHRGSLTVRRGARAVEWKSHPLNLTATEFRILDFLAWKDGVAHPYEKLRLAAQIQEVSDIDIDFRNEDEKRREKTKALRATLHTHVRSIRLKLEAADEAATSASGVRSPPFEGKLVLVTEHDFGYRWRRDT